MPEIVPYSCQCGSDKWCLGKRQLAAAATVTTTNSFSLILLISPSLPNYQRRLEDVLFYPRMSMGGFSGEELAPLGH